MRLLETSFLFYYFLSSTHTCCLFLGLASSSVLRWLAWDDIDLRRTWSSRTKETLAVVVVVVGENRVEVGCRRRRRRHK